MTIETRIIPFGWFDVDSAPNASAQYPILNITETHERQGVDGASIESLRKVTIVIDSVTQVVAAETTNQVVERLQAELARRGAQVRINEMAGAARIFKSGGGSGGAVEGWPRVTVEMIPENSVPPLQFFRVRIETLIPIAAGLPSHDFTSDAIQDEGGLVTLRVRGKVRTDSGVDAAIWITNNIIEPARLAAQASLNKFSMRLTRHVDESLAEYEYTDAPVGAASLPSDVVNAEVRDVTVEERIGRRVRTVSGFAVGSGATTFAVNQDPSSPNVFLTRKSIGVPTVPEGRVEFSYEALDGVASTDFPNLTVFEFTQSISETVGGRPVVSASYDSAAPKLYLGAQAPFLYTESSTLLFTGAWANAVIPLAFGADNLAALPRESRSSRGGGVRELRMERVYAFSSSQDIPDVKEVAAFS